MSSADLHSSFDRRELFRRGAKLAVGAAVGALVYSKRHEIGDRCTKVVDDLMPFPGEKEIEKIVKPYVSDQKFAEAFKRVVNEKTIPHKAERDYVIMQLLTSRGPLPLDDEMLVPEANQPPSGKIPLTKTEILEYTRHHLRTTSEVVFQIKTESAARTAWLDGYAPSVLQGNIETAVQKHRAAFALLGSAPFVKGR